MQKLLPEAAVEPNKCTELMPEDPAYMKFIDASGEGCVGVWMGVTEELDPIVWRQEWILELK